MTSSSLFQLPDDLLLSILDEQFPCREQQTRALATLIDPHAAPCRSCVVHGTEATGKSALVAALLRSLANPKQHVHKDDTDLNYAIINSLECVTGRHLFEKTIVAVAEALNWENPASRCETMSQLTFELSKMLKYTQRPANWRFVLVFDAIDHQREAPPTLIPALARLSEIIPCLTSVFIVTSPFPSFLRTSFVAHVHFPNYTKNEFIKILSTTPPPALPNATNDETADLWTRFCGAVHDALTKSAARTLPAFQHACDSLWRRFTAPIRDGNIGPREFPKLLIAARVHFQDESLLDPGIIVHRSDASSKPTPASAETNGILSFQTNGSQKESKPPQQKPNPTGTSLAALLPSTARILLVAAYLASHNATKHDLTLFSTYHHGRRKRHGGGGLGRMGPRSKHRKIARKLLGAHTFVLERMIAIYTAVRSEWGIGGADGSVISTVDADVGMALATLSSLRLLVRVGSGGDPLDRGGRWRVNVGWEVVRGLGRSMGVEVEEWLID